MVQLLIRKNADGDTALNLAVKHKNFRCFELMLSILLNAKDSFISRQFLTDLRFMMEMETNVVESFFDQKFVTNVSTSAIEKVKWSIDADSVGMVTSSQLFTKDQIEELTYPAEDREDTEEQKKKVDEGGSKTVVKPTLDIHSQLQQQRLKELEMVPQAAMKAVDVKLLDLDWVF